MASAEVINPLQQNDNNNIDCEMAEPEESPRENLSSPDEAVEIDKVWVLTL